MFQRIRRSLAMIGLLTAFFLALPAPSQAAALWEPAASAGIAVRVWSWLESLGLAPWPAATSRRPVALWNKDKQGSMIDPNGVPTNPPAVVTDSDQGSGIDPNGTK
jgi:hypothetical protein